MNITELLTPYSNHCPDRAAVIHTRGNKHVGLTYRQLESSSLSVCRRLKQSGLQRGDKVLVVHAVTPELFAILLGIFRAEMVAVLPDPSAVLDRLITACRRVRPHAVVYSAKSWLISLICSELRSIPVQLSTVPLPGTALLPVEAVGTIASCAPASADPASALNSKEGLLSQIEELPALLSFTSGSTGEPKGIMRTQRFLAAQCLAVSHCTSPVFGTVQLVSLPVFVLANLAYGVTSVLPHCDLRRPAEVNAGKVIKQMEDLNCTEILASPALIQKIALHGGSHESLLAIKRVFTGGAPVFHDQLEKWRRGFPQAEIHVVYGSSEAEPISRLRLDQLSRRDSEQMLDGAGLLAGRPAPGTSLAIVREEAPLAEKMSASAFGSCLADDGGVGEIFVSGDHVVKTYEFDDSGTISKVNVEETIWHRTGDAGYIDKCGRLWLLGRSSARLADKDGSLYPLTVESVVRNQLQIERSALVRQPSGQRALILECRSARAAQLQSRLEQLARRFAVSQVYCVNKVPLDRRHNSKIDYPALMKVMARRLK